jgi:hypothetical protein
MTMTKENLMHLVSRFGLVTAILASAAVLSACGGEPGEAGLDLEQVGESEQAFGPGGTNNLPPSAIDSDPLKRSVTNAFGITTPTNPDPLQLCAAGTASATDCLLTPAWESWMSADLQNRVPMMKGIVKCTVGSDFTIESSTGTESFAGQWALYPSWTTSRLAGQAKRERVSSCILSLLNGNDETLDICIIGPGAPFSDACSDPGMTIREAGFFGDLFAATPKAYVAGPDTAEPALTGRACFGELGNYCCPEEDTACEHRIVLAGAILGSPDQGFANKRCNAPLVNSGVNAYCPSFYSTREPGRSYTNAFTTFVPPLP